MSKSIHVFLIVTLAVMLAAALFYGGMYYANAWYRPADWFGSGMMGRPYNTSPSCGASSYGRGMMGSHGSGMMGRYGSNQPYGVQPLTEDTARSAVQTYLARLGNDDLSIEEIMIFDNHAYAIVVEKSSGVGAFELLVDPITLAVYPEYGPNMMWNLKYGMMSGNSSYGGIMGGGMMNRYPGNSNLIDISAAMPVTPEQALESAQNYLDAHLPGMQVSDEITSFYGYYTIDLVRDGQIVGMLSVNGYTRQVFFHTWHGDFISMSGE